MMKPLLIRRPQDLPVQRRGERGVTIVLVALAMVSIIAMAALSIDVVTLYLARGEAQRSADSAALAAARVISMSGVTGDPSNSGAGVGAPPWPIVCAAAKQVAQSVANQSTVGRSVPAAVNVSFVYNGTDTALCASVPAAFAVNPQVQVQVQQTALPTFFSRIWGRTGNTVSAVATAEVLNPSNSGPAGGNSIVGVRPRCVKPWVVPNLDPLNPANPPNCTGNCQHLVNITDGSITNAGISMGGLGTNGVIGETFNLFPDCRFGGTCTLRDNPPVTNRTVSGVIPPIPNLEYLPGEVSNPSTAVPSGPAAACDDVGSNYAQAIAGCDQSTAYQCGVQNGNVVNHNENPRTTQDTAKGVQCLIHQGTAGLGVQSGQDQMDTSTTFPFPITAESGNPLGITGSVVSISNSIVSLPIYDKTPVTNTINATGTSAVEIVGFLQVFINSVDINGNVNVTVLNVAGCAPSPAKVLTGSSPVPVRLITP